MIKFNQVSKSFSISKLSLGSGLLPMLTRQQSPVSDQVQANRDISFTCQPGKIHGLLGVNGAGKSTALKILSGLIQADQGNVTIDKIDIAAAAKTARRNMGVFLSSDGLYPKLTTRENIELFASLHQLNNIDQSTNQIIDDLHLRPIANRRVEGFSTGQKMKVALARALVHQPKYVILDEPTRGLDVMSIRLLREYLTTLKQRGCCVLFSSHVMQEVEKLCDDLTIIHDGAIQYTGTLEKFVSHDQSNDLEQAFINAVGA